MSKCQSQRRVVPSTSTIQRIKDQSQEMFTAQHENKCTRNLKYGFNIIQPYENIIVQHLETLGGRNKRYLYFKKQSKKCGSVLLNNKGFNGLHKIYISNSECLITYIFVTMKHRSFFISFLFFFSFFVGEG